MPTISKAAIQGVSVSAFRCTGNCASGHFSQARKLRHLGIRLPGRFAQVKEETAQRAGDIEQNVQAA
jgi:hypothetical protein